MNCAFNSNRAFLKIILEQNKKKKKVLQEIAHVAQSVERFLGKEEVQRFDSVRGLHNPPGRELTFALAVISSGINLGG